MALENTRTDATYVSVLSDGSMRVSVPEGTDGAVRRDYETSDGKKGTKYELVYTQLTGIITGIQFRDGDFGKQLQVTVTDGDETPIVLSLNTSSNFAEDLLKKIPAIDMTKPVKLAPFSFEDDNGKLRKGMTVVQDEKKVQNFFYDFHEKKNLHGYPDPVFKKTKTGEVKPFSKEEWKIYFAQCRVFLIEYIEANHLKVSNNALDDASKDRAKVDEIYDGLDDPEAEPAF